MTRTFRAAAEALALQKGGACIDEARLYELPASGLAPPERVPRVSLTPVSTAPEAPLTPEPTAALA